MSDMVYIPPMAVAYALLGSFGDDVGTVVDVVALTVMVAGILLVSRYRSALTVSDAAADAWEAERNASVSRAERLEEMNNDLNTQLMETRAEVAALRAKPDLDALYGMLVDHDKRVVLLHEKMVASLESNSDALKTLVADATKDRPAQDSH